MEKIYVMVKGRSCILAGDRARQGLVDKGYRCNAHVSIGEGLRLQRRFFAEFKRPAEECAPCVG